MATIKFKRTTGVGAPAGGLEPGELAYAQGSNKLFVGNKALDEHFDKIALQIETGTAGSTNFNAISGLGATLTATPSDGNVVWSTDINDPFGGNLPSIKLDGTNYLSVANDSSLNFGSGDFTVEFWYYRPTSVQGSDTSRTLISFRHNNGNAQTPFLKNENAWFLWGNTWTARPSFYGETSGDTQSGDFDSWHQGNYLLGDKWNHYVVQRTGNDTWIIGGHEPTNDSGGWVTGSGYSSIGSNAMVDTTGPFVIGANSNDQSNYTGFAAGYFFDIRYTKGLARYNTSGGGGTETGQTPSVAFASGAGDPQVVLDGSLIQPNTATEPTKIVVKETNASSANSLTLKAPTVSSDYTLTLPTANPGSTTPLLVGSDGAMSYGDVSVATVSEIGDVGRQGDPEWDSVIALVDFDGDITDHKGHSITGDTDSGHYGTDNGKFGGAFTNNGSDATLVKIEGLTETGDTTIECWFNVASLSAAYNFLFWTSDSSWGGKLGAWISVASNGKLSGWHYSGSATITGVTTVSVDTWYHLVWQCTGADVKIWMAPEGGSYVEEYSETMNNSYLPFEFQGDKFQFGSENAGMWKLNGKIDDLRITNKARYSTINDIVVPTVASKTEGLHPLVNEDLLLYSSSLSKWDTVEPSAVKTLIGIGEDSNVEYENVTVNNILSVNGNSSVNSSSVVTVRDRLITLGHPPTMVSGDYSVTDGVVTVTCVQPISGTVGDNIWVDVTDSQIPTGIYSMQPGDDWSGGAVTNVEYRGGSSHGTNIWSGGPTGGYYSISQQGQTVTGANGFTFVVDQGATNQGNLFHYAARNHSPQSRTISINATDASGVLRNYSYTWNTRYNSTNGGDWTDNSVIMDIVATQGEEALDGVADPNYHGGYINWNDESRTYRIWIETAQALPWYNNEQVGQTIRGRRTWQSINKYPNNAGTQNNHSSKPVNTQENASYGFVTGWAYGGGSVDGGWPSLFYLTVDNWVNTGATTFKFNLSDSSITGITGQLTYSAGAITDSAVSGGGIIIPGSTQKKLQWVEDGSVSSADEWNLVGGDLKIDSGESTNTALYVGETQKVIEVDADGQSGTIDSNFSFDENTTLTGDFDFGEFS